MTGAPRTIRLIYPQWQGADISSLLKELPADDASRGYYLGAELLNFLAPDNAAQKTLTVPVCTEITQRKVYDGVLDRDVIFAQTKSALEILKNENPERIIVLGGECSVSVAPFTYLAGKYGDDTAVIWIDAHPDITLPGDPYHGYHAMAAAALAGMGDEKIISLLPARIDPSKILFVGLRDWERDEIKERQIKFGMKHINAHDVSETSAPVTDWLESKGIKNVLIHFDLDVLDPAQIIPAVGVVPGGIKLEEVTRLINDISDHSCLKALTIAEPMPRVAIRLKTMMENLPLFK